MGHPFAAHRQHHVEKERVSHIHKGYAKGGAVHSDEAEDKALVKKMVKGSAMKHRMAGGKVTARLDRKARAAGGRTKHKGKTVVNVNVAPHPGGAMPMAMPGGPPMMPPAMPPRPPMAPPMAGPPGAPPGAPGLPPGAPPMGAMGMHKKGGRVQRARGGSVKDGPTWNEGRKAGTQVQHSDGNTDRKNMGRGKPITYATGGKVTPGFSIKEARGARGVDRLGVEMTEGGGPKLPGGAAGGEARLYKAHHAKRS